MHVPAKLIINNKNNNKTTNKKTTIEIKLICLELSTSESTLECPYFRHGIIVMPRMTKTLPPENKASLPTSKWHFQDKLTSATCSGIPTSDPPCILNPQGCPVSYRLNLTTLISEAIFHFTFINSCCGMCVRLHLCYCYM